MNMRASSRWLALLGIASGSASATDVDLVKTGPGRAEAFAWQGRTLSQVLPVDAIERIVLLKAVTSAPADLDLRNLRRMLRDAAGAPLRTADHDGQGFPQLGSNDTIWEAVLLTRAGDVFGLVIRPDVAAAGEGAHRACLTDEAGRRGCFGIPAVPAG